MARNQQLQVWLDYREQKGTPKGKEIQDYLEELAPSIGAAGFHFSSGWYGKPGLSDPVLQRHMEVKLRDADRVVKFHTVMSIVMDIRNRFPTEVKIRCNLRAPTKLAHLALLTNNRFALSEHCSVFQVGRRRLKEEPRLTYKGMRILKTWVIGEHNATRRVEANLKRILAYSPNPERFHSVERTMDNVLAQYSQWLYHMRERGMGYSSNETDAAVILEMEDGHLEVIIDSEHQPLPEYILTLNYPDDLWERPECNRQYFKAHWVLNLADFPKLERCHEPA